MKASVSIIEDNLLFRKSLIKYISLQEEFDIGSQFGSVAPFLAEFKMPDESNDAILLLDVGLPGLSGTDAIPEILKKYPKLNIIMLTNYEEEEIILKALCSGACAYILKQASMSEIVAALRIVVAGGSYMSPSIAREIINHLMGGRVDKATILTERQREILKRLAEGKSYAVIANELYISIETVRTHLKKMYKILQVNNKTEAIAKYIRGQIK